MSLNGGYIIIDLDNTTGTPLVNALASAYENGKPVIAIKDGVANYCMLSKITNYYILNTNDNNVYKIFTFNGALTTEKHIAQYKHILKFSGTFSGTDRTIIVEITNRKPDAYSNANSALIGIGQFGHTNETKPKLVTDTTAICGLLYISGTSNKSANYKAMGADSFATVAATSLTVSDAVINLATIEF